MQVFDPEIVAENEKDVWAIRRGAGRLGGQCGKRAADCHQGQCASREFCGKGHRTIIKTEMKKVESKREWLKYHLNLP
jgi:hypothetical protein